MNQVASPNSSLTSEQALPKWDYETWAKTKSKQTHPLKERLLKGSLDLVKGQGDNAEVCYEVVKQALNAGLFDVAFEGVQTFSINSGLYFFYAIQRCFSEMGYWEHMSEEFIAECEQRILNDSSSGDEDDRSEALGYLGRLRFFTGKQEAAVTLWKAAGDAKEADKIIAEMCEEVAKHSPQSLEAALSLLDLMKTQKIKAKTMATLSKYA